MADRSCKDSDIFAVLNLSSNGKDDSFTEEKEESSDPLCNQKIAKNEDKMKVEPIRQDYAQIYQEVTPETNRVPTLTPEGRQTHNPVPRRVNGENKNKPIRKRAKQAKEKEEKDKPTRKRAKQAKEKVEKNKPIRKRSKQTKEKAKKTDRSHNYNQRIARSLKKCIKSTLSRQERNAIYESFIGFGERQKNIYAYMLTVKGIKSVKTAGGLSHCKVLNQNDAIRMQWIKWIDEGKVQSDIKGSRINEKDKSNYFQRSQDKQKLKTETI